MAILDNFQVASAFRTFEISSAGWVRQQRESESKVRRLEHQFKRVMIYKMVDIKPAVNVQGVV